MSIVGKTFENYQGLFLLLLFWVSVLLSTVVLPFVLVVLELETKLSFYLKTFLGQVFAYLLPIVILLLATRQRAKKGFKKTGFFQLERYTKENKTNYLPFILLTAIFYLTVHFFVDAFTNMYMYFTDDFSVAPEVSYPTFPEFLSVVLVFAVMPALIEEITYRGMYYSTFHNNKVLLYLVPTFVFAFSHGSILSVIISIFLGLFLVNAMDMTKNLKLMILLHFIYNFFSLLFSNYIKTPISPGAFLEANQLPEAVLGASLINLAIALFLLVAFWKCREYIKRARKVAVLNHKKPEESDKYKIINYLSGALLCVSALVLFVIRFI